MDNNTFVEIGISWVNDNTIHLENNIGSGKIGTDRITWSDGNFWKRKQNVHITEWDNDIVCNWIDSIPALKR
eukprot:UN07933